MLHVVHVVEDRKAWLPIPGSRFFVSEPAGDDAAGREILEVLVALNKGLSAEQVVDLLFDTLDPLIPVDRIGIAMLEPGDQLVSRYVRSRAPVLWGVGDEGSVADSSLEPIVLRRRLRIIEDLELYRANRPSARCDLLLQEGMRSNLSVPLLISDRVTGVVFFSSFRPHAYTEEHLPLAQTLAMSLAVAIERGELLDGLRRANEELSTLDELKTNFLATVSHELRTPLHKVINYAFALQDGLAGPVSGEQRVFLQEMMSAAERMSRIVNDLLDFTAIGAGKVRLRPVLSDLNEAARQWARDWREQFKARGLIFELKVAREPVLGLVDLPRISRMMGFLLENAQTFTPAPGRVTLKIGATPDRALLSVVDSGIGIEPAVQPKIFDKFFQADQGSTRRFGGMGLGLAFAKAIAEAHAGEIRVASTPGKGATFTVSLPRALR